MARNGTPVDPAARVAEMATGPVPEQSLIFFPPPGTGQDGPPLEPPHPYLSITLDEPVSGPVSAPATQGVVLTARGSVDFSKYTVDRVEVKFPGSGFVPATLKPLEGWTFSATSKPIKTPGKQLVIARVIARKTTNGAAADPPPQVLRTVDVQLGDDIPPSVQITRPGTGTVLKPGSGGMYAVPLEAKIDDSSGIASAQYLTSDGGFQPLLPSDGLWKPAPGAVVPYRKQAQTVGVLVEDNAAGQHNWTWASIQVHTQDVTAPVVKIDGDSAISLPEKSPNGGAVLPVFTGTAVDAHSGVKSVEWSLDGGPFAPVTSLLGIGDTAYWRVENVTLPTSGPHVIRVRARDNADLAPGVTPNLSAEVQLKVAVTVKYRPKDPTVPEYYSALVDFVARRLLVGGAAATPAKLGGTLHQPFQQLLGADPAVSTVPVAQLRIVLEVLRKHFDAAAAAAMPFDPLRVQQAKNALSAAEKAYLRAAYEAVLRGLGTSADELDRALRSEPAARRALADRLGIDLGEGKAPTGVPVSNLTAFFLGPDRLTAAELERLFGLVDLAGGPLLRRDDDPLLLDLQLRRLQKTWTQQDELAGVPVVDPDVIGEDDVRPGAEPALVLLRARRGWLDGLLEALRGRPGKTGADQPARLDGVLELMQVPVRDLQKLDADSAAGEDVAPGLAALRLGFPAFRRLVALRRLAGQQALTEADWEDAYAILIQVRKERAREEWCDTERGAGLHLGPAFFAVGDVQRPGPPPSPWRTVPGARQRWRSVLQGRLEQRQTVRQALASAVATTEEEALPGLRDGLLKALSVLSPASGPELTRALQVDVMTGGGIRVGRVEQAIQSLQSLLVGVRTGTAPGWSRIPSETQEDFDEELRWMGSYANWYAAMQVYLYPENFLAPTLRPPDDVKGPLWKPFLAGLRQNRQLTPEQAVALAAPYGITLRRTTTELQALRTESNNAIPAGPNDIARLRAIPPGTKEKFYFVPMALALALHRSGQYLAAIDWFRMVYAYDLQFVDRFPWWALWLERDPEPTRELVYERNVFWLTETLNAHDIVDESYQPNASPRYDVHTRFVLLSLVRCLLDFADSEFQQDTNEALPRARALYQQALDLLGLPALNPVKVAELSTNEAVVGLRWRAETALAKLRSGRNAAGLSRQLETVTPLASPAGGSPLVLGSGPFGSGSLRAFQPTPYRYAALAERAKLLVGIAQQVEQSYLAALEKRDAEAYSLFKAQQDLALANANAQLQTFRATEAAAQVVLAERQQDRAAFQVAAYQGLLDEPMNSWEHRLLDDFHDALVARNWVAGLDAAVTATQAVQSAFSLDPAKLLGGGTAAAAVGVLAAVRAGAVVNLNNIETDIQRHSLHASVENRVREWELQQGVARKDEAISAQQIQVARDQQAIVAQEGRIAQLQFTQALAVVSFLTTKFTNVELYEWMVEVLQGVYGYFLRQATATALLAQHQLAFESQERVPVLIRRDYWQPSDDALLGETDQQRDRQGLTGSARLLQDLYQLDQFAFDTTRRKLQLSRTLSLARLAPLEFQRFRETGVLTFATPTALFDQDFPGHYLRLVKRVRTSVVALVPPQEGIRATLSNLGVSRVVVGGDSFQTVRLTREPESVALTAPANASGVFELDSQPELLQPFELGGVDSIWTFELPKAANPFDFRTIADVLVTIDYTALSSEEHRRRVVQQLDRTVLATRSYSVRDAFPDQWYDLHNPGPDGRLSVELPVRAADFPVNVDGVTTGQLALLVVLDRDEPPTPVRVKLAFAPADGSAPAEGEATSTSAGLVSTRVGNAAAWTPMLNRSPIGSWRLTFPEVGKVRALLDRDAVLDLALLVTYTGQTPEWPRG